VTADADTPAERLQSRLRGASREERDDARFERLFDAEAQNLLAFLTLRTAGDRSLAEDILADAFERVLRKRRSFNPRRGTEKNWLYSIALNLLTDHLRRGQAERRALERAAGGDPETAADPYQGASDRDLLRRGMTVLSAEERDAVSLRFGAELTMPEIANLTGEPLSTVEGRIYRALRKLRDQVSNREVGIRPPRS
jgi:RNA polymerase sigma factor (sigma-70 family)